MRSEAEIKRQLMAEEFNYQIQLEQMKAQRETNREAQIEDRKDKRTRIAGSQQSAMIDQRKNDLMPTNFEQQSQEERNASSLIINYLIILYYGKPKSGRRGQTRR